MEYQTFLLPEGMTINNQHFNDQIDHNDELSLDIKPVTFGKVPHDSETWGELAAEDQLALYDSKHLQHFIAVEFSIDNTDKVHDIILKETTEAGRILAKKSKRDKLEKMALAKAKPAKAVEPKKITS
jgi:hypothetical protein